MRSTLDRVEGSSAYDLHYKSPVRDSTGDPTPPGPVESASALIESLTALTFIGESCKWGDAPLYINLAPSCQ